MMPKGKKARVALTREEWAVVVDAIRVAPDPEMFDFGPAYESAKEARATVLEKIRRALATTAPLSRVRG